MVQDALLKIVYGMYIVTSKHGEKLNGMIATTACQVTAEPMRMTVGINKESLTHGMIEASKSFGVSVLSTEADFSFIGRFGFKTGRDVEKLEGVHYVEGETGVPLVTDNAIAIMESRVIGSMDAGTHTIFLGEVVDARILSDKQAMTYDYYQNVIKGKSPKSAPTYHKPGK